MKPRPDGFLREEHIDHNSEIFDYIRELHEYLWKFIRMTNPGAGGALNDHIDKALEGGFFQNLHGMNLADEKNGTSNVAICPDVISADCRDGSTIVKIGVPGNIVTDILLESTIPMLLLINRKEYESWTKQNS